MAFSVFLRLFPVFKCVANVHKTGEQTTESNGVLAEKVVCFPGVQKAVNGVRLLYNQNPRPDGYIIVTFRHPQTGRVTSCSCHRAAVMLERGTVSLPLELDASHICAITRLVSCRGGQVPAESVCD